MYQRQTFTALFVALLLLCVAQTAFASEPPDERAGEPSATWVTIELPGASCGRGASYRYFLNVSDTPNQPLVVYFEGGGACIKEGYAPGGTSGPALQLYCTSYSNFGSPSQGLIAHYGIFRRDLSDNAYRDANYAYIPYCTGDLHAGTATELHDYDPAPDASFDVLHRGHLNAQIALDELATRFPTMTQVILTGSSAGALGALYNFPSVISRWPATTLVMDAGTLPDVPSSLLGDLLQRPTLPWQPQAILPPYCSTLDCFANTSKLIAAHADQYDGEPLAWHGFGVVQGQLDGTLAGYMEVSTCAYRQGLYRDTTAFVRPNLRNFLPDTSVHTFLGAPPDFPIPGTGNYRQSIGGTTLISWMGALTNADDETALPASLSDVWPLFGDLNNNGSIDVGDIQQVAEQWATPTPACPADGDGDGDIDISDIQMIAGAFS